MYIEYFVKQSNAHTEVLNFRHIFLNLLSANSQFIDVCLVNQQSFLFKLK